MNIDFFKYHGTGNDFVILDNRDQQYNSLTEQQIEDICHRRFGVGADGLMLCNLHPEYDFEMKYYNSNGKEGSMCGNGGRCIVQFAYDLGIHKTSYEFMAVDGLHQAEIDLNGWIRLKMQDVNKIDTHFDTSVLNTGSPHFVKYVNNVRHMDVVKEGKEIRYGKTYEKEGINVNFIQTLDDHTIYVRTYERGVEDETYSCGTGVTAAALVAAHNETGYNQVDVQTRGGKLSVEFDKNDEQHFTNIWLSGPAQFVFSGHIKLAD
jgi:diaminopimelate epimerase